MLNAERRREAICARAPDSLKFPVANGSRKKN
jgi:hypothetical protein